MTAISGTYTPFTLDERYWMKVNKNGDIPPGAPELGNCWIWTGRIHDYGYGIFTIKGKQVRAHRLMWEMHHGQPIPHGLIVRHRCDMRPCVRPEHLVVGDHSDNAADAVRRQRVACLKGENSPSAKLTKDVVQWARQQWESSQLSKAELARRCGVSVTTMTAVLERRSWKHVD